MLRALVIAGLLVAQVATASEVKRDFVLGSPLEVAVLPAKVQVGLDTRHVGAGGSFSWHLNESFAVQVSGFYNHVSAATPLLMGGREPVSDEGGSMLNVWGAFAGMEFAPLRGQSNVGRFSIVLNAGLGLGATRLELAPANSRHPGRYGDTGLRFLASAGGGLRLELARNFGIRLEVHDVLFSDHVQTINGCNAGDLRALAALRDPVPITVSGSCRVSEFGMNPSTLRFIRGDSRSEDVPLANHSMRRRSSAVVHNVTVQLGAAFQF